MPCMRGSRLDPQVASQKVPERCWVGHPKKWRDRIWGSTQNGQRGLETRNHRAAASEECRDRIRGEAGNRGPGPGPRIDPSVPVPGRRS